MYQESRKLNIKSRHNQYNPMRYFIFLFSLLITKSSIAQTSNCESLKKENDYLIKALQLQQDTGLFSFTTSDKFHMKLISVEGDRKNRTIKLSFISTNLGSRKEFYNFYMFLSGTKLIDHNGTEYTKPETFIGKPLQRTSVLESNTPVKSWFIFYDIIEDLPFIKKAVLKYDNQEFFELNNLKVQWK